MKGLHMSHNETGKVLNTAFNWTTGLYCTHQKRLSLDVGEAQIDATCRIKKELHS